MMSGFVKSNLADQHSPLDAAVLDAVYEQVVTCQMSHRNALQEAYAEIDRLNAELAKPQAEREPLVEQMNELKAERDKLKSQLLAMHAEPIDNGDGTVTRLLPVTCAKGLDVVRVRAPIEGDSWVSPSSGNPMRIRNLMDSSPHDIRLILRPAPPPPEPVTWEAPLVDGEWTATTGGFTGADNRRWLWDSTGSIICGLHKPAALGTYQFEGGVGTLIREAS